jgi:hypothetical protein
MIIKIGTPEGDISIEGECIKSELQWSRNVEKRTHISGGTFSAKQVPTDCYNEIWEFEGRDGQVQVLKIVTAEGLKYSLLEDLPRHGGRRPGAGRKPTGRKQRSIWLTDAEHEKVKEFVKELKTHENPKP